MSKYRIKFSKTGMGKFISHLDLLRAFNRTVMRAGLPVKYSKGFNPHQIMTFSLPLPVGVESKTEFADVEFEDTVSPEEILNGLNEHFPADLHALSVYEPRFKAKDIFAAEYDAAVRADFSESTARIDEFFSQKEYMIVKKSKKGEKEVNLMDYVFSCEFLDKTDDLVKMKLTLAAGGEKNIKTVLVFSAHENYLAPLEIDLLKITRTKIFCKNGEKVEIFC